MNLSSPVRPSRRLPMQLKNIPILFEDEDEEDMGEANRHTEANEVLHVCLAAFLKLRRPRMRVYADMNCYYLRKPTHPKTRSRPYFSADVMIVKPTKRLSRNVVSYTIGTDGPAPLATIEVMSRRTFKKIDLDVKLTLYAMLGIGEYIMVDPTGQMLPERLLLKRLQPDRTWSDEKDPDGGVTSKLGFRILMDEFGDLTIIDAKTGRAFIRPQDAEFEAEARRQETEARQMEAAGRQLAEERALSEAAARLKAEERLRELEEELKRLRRRQD